MPAPTWTPAGKRNKQVTLQTCTDSQGSTFGNATQTWTDGATVWAMVSPINGREFLSADKMSAVVTHRVRMSYLPGVTAKHRLQILPRGANEADDRVLNIVAVINIEERNRELELMCVEQV